MGAAASEVLDSAESASLSLSSSVQDIRGTFMVWKYRMSDSLELEAAVVSAGALEVVSVAV